MAEVAPIRVLLIDDDPVTAAVVRGYLQANGERYRLSLVERYDLGLDAAMSTEHDVVIIDDCLDHHTGAQLLAGLQQRGCRLPLIVLTNRRDRAFESLVRDLGAAEVLTRSELSASALDRTLRYAHCRRRDADQLRAWARTARAMTSALPSPCALLDPGGRVIECNSALCELLGKAYGEIVGHGAARILAGGAIGADAPPRIWTDTARTDGGEQQVRCSCQPLPDGGCLLSLEVNADSTRIFRRLTADPDEVSLLRNLMAHLPDQIYLKDRRSRYVLNNPSHLAILGASDQAAVVGKTDHDFFPPDLADAYLADERLVIDGGQVVLDKIERVITTAGEETWVSVSKAPLRDERGRIIGLVGMSRDITDRMDDAQALAEQQRRIAALVGAAPVVLFSFDAKGCYTLCEGAGLSGLGLRPGELVGRSVFEAHPDSPSVRDIARRALDGERVAVEDLAIGERRFSVRLEPTRDDLGQVREVIGVAYDITEQHQIRSELQLRDSEFLQAQKMEAVGRLAGGVTHDFNNVLTAILGHAELLRERLVATREREAVDRIAAVARKGSAMTRRLLAFCRRQVVDPRPVDLTQVVRATVELAQPLVGDGVQIQLVLPSSPLVVLGDEVQLEQVLLNLVVNARDAMDGRGRITIAASLEAGEILLTVTDTGPGMDAATLARCREPFFTTKGEGTGTGLGLATVGDILGQFGGVLEIQSAPDAGCTIFITLPAIAGTADGGSTFESSAAHPAMRLPQRVLVAEDQADVRAMLGETLQQLGVEVVECRDGLAAWHLLDTDPAPCDVLISDIHMPGMDGNELGQRVVARHPELPILFISGHVDEPGELPSGPRYRLLAKPFSRRRLVQYLGELMVARAGS